MELTVGLFVFILLFAPFGFESPFLDEVTFKRKSWGYVIYGFLLGVVILIIVFEFILSASIKIGNVVLSFYR